VLVSRSVLGLTEEDVAAALRIARWYGRRTRHEEVSDLEGAALEGLTKAARDFDPGVASRTARPASRRQSFWRFAFARILGEMKDELRSIDHLTRQQRALVAKDETGELLVDHDELEWIKPDAPLPLDASVTAVDGQTVQPIVDTIETPRNPIDEFELRDAFCRATAQLPERERLVLLKRELEGYSNSELAHAFDVTEGRTSQLRGSALEQMRKLIGDSFVDAA
jgi:RNA polymerase sigma factor (sigma-70 family)